MKKPIRVLVSLLFALATIQIYTSARTIPFARAVTAYISIDGTDILMGGTSDNGAPDADAVWDYLKTLTFFPTKDFEAFDLQAKDDVLLVHGEPDDQHGLTVPFQKSVKLALNYGGVIELRELKLVPGIDYRGQAGWRVAAEFPEKYFDYRLIDRRQVRGLKSVMRKGKR